MTRRLVKRKSYMSDPAYAYIDKAFPGRKLLIPGIVSWGLYLLSHLLIHWDMAPATLRNAVWLILALTALLYFRGYWLALKGKDYPPVLFLCAFTGIIGAIIIMYLPERRQKSQQPDEASRPPETLPHAPK